MSCTTEVRDNATRGRQTDECIIGADIIDAYNEDEREAIYQYLSENTDKAVHKKTEEEGLQQLFNFLKIALERDIRLKKEKKAKKEAIKAKRDRGEAVEAEEDEEDEEEEEHQGLALKYPGYVGRLKIMNKTYIGINSGYRRLTCMPTFMFGLVQASRVRRHYLHASWFRVTNFNKMLEVHGGVSAITLILCLIWRC